MRPVRLRHFAWLLAALCLPCTQAAAANLVFTVATSESVVVTGVPRIAIDVGGITRYATYASGSGTSSLTFAYAVQPGDFDGNGIALASPLDLNSGAITDIAGNPASSLAFTLPDTSALKVQTYTASFTTSPITNSNATAVGLAIAKAPTGASFTYTITSSGGGRGLFLAPAQSPERAIPSRASMSRHSPPARSRSRSPSRHLLAEPVLPRQPRRTRHSPASSTASPLPWPYLSAAFVRATRAHCCASAAPATVPLRTSARQSAAISMPLHLPASAAPRPVSFPPGMTNPETGAMRPSQRRAFSQGSSRPA